MPNEAKLLLLLAVAMAAEEGEGGETGILYIYGTIDDTFPKAIRDIPPMCLNILIARFPPADEYAQSGCHNFIAQSGLN